MVKDEISLRPAEPTDAVRLFQWVNEPKVRAMAINSSTISWANHLTWFQTSLKSANCDIFIANYGAHSIGQIRIDWRLVNGLVDIHLADDFRSKGFGSAMLKMAVNRMRDKHPCNLLTAFVKIGNAASSNLFLKSGFVYRGVAVIDGYLCYEYSFLLAKFVEFDKVSG
jgi:RimJ/RimL family protein N-acetyltransferase